VLVEDVDPYGPADGLLLPPAQRIDVITAVEGKAVRSEAELRSALKGFKAGEIVTLSVFQPQQAGGQGGTSIIRVKLAN
jgi:S1-C subfamily serine protease